VPLYVQDVSGTPLGTDASPGNRIQAISFQISFPAIAVTSASFTRAGALAGLTPAVEQTANGSGSIGWLASFKESTQPIPLTINAAIPGNRIGTLLLTLANGLANGLTVALTFKPGNTLLSNQGGTLEEATFDHGAESSEREHHDWRCNHDDRARNRTEPVGNRPAGHLDGMGQLRHRRHDHRPGLFL
jgi:hypothetical protein